MWSEHFGRVAKVAEKVETRGVPFRMTLDHSHVIFKIDNPEEQEILGMRADVDSGAVVLDPDAPGNVCDLWIGRGWNSTVNLRRSEEHTSELQSLMRISYAVFCL